MKATELRIGNWYYAMTISGNWIESQVRDGKQLDILDGCSIDEAKPIPLTEEWLIRFGFECKDFSFRKYCTIELPKDENGYQMHLVFWFEPDGEFESCWLASDEYESEDGYEAERAWDYSHIKHVHTLQNLIHAITGEELTIDK